MRKSRGRTHKYRTHRRRTYKYRTHRRRTYKYRTHRIHKHGGMFSRVATSVGRRFEPAIRTKIEEMGERAEPKIREWSEDLIDAKIKKSKQYNDIQQKLGELTVISSKENRNPKETQPNPLLINAPKPTILKSLNVPIAEKSNLILKSPPNIKKNIDVVKTSGILKNAPSKNILNVINSPQPKLEI
jgi:hypothetical protein